MDLLKNVVLVVQPVNINANVNTILKERVVISVNLDINNMHGVQEQVKAHSNVEVSLCILSIELQFYMERLTWFEKYVPYSV